MYAKGVKRIRQELRTNGETLLQDVDELDDFDEAINCLAKALLHQRAEGLRQGREMALECKRGWGDDLLALADALEASDDAG